MRASCIEEYSLWNLLHSFLSQRVAGGLQFYQFSVEKNEFVKSMDELQDISDDATGYILQNYMQPAAACSTVLNGQ